MDLAYTHNQQRLNIRVAVVIKHDDKYLVINDGHAPYHYLIGGRVKFGETSLEAAYRELNEELGESLQIERLLFTYESFFYESTLKLNYHELGTIYLAHLNQASVYIKEKETILNQNRFLWIDQDEFAHPNFIFQYIKEKGIPLTPVHLISNEMP